MQSTEVPTNHLFAIAKLRRGETHFVPDARDVPFNSVARTRFIVSRIYRPKPGVKVERVA